MKQTKLLLVNSLVAVCILFMNSCSTAQVSDNSSSEIMLVASTPGDSIIKSLLTIPPDTKVDFIRWNLAFKKGENDSKIFLLNINFGVGQANTTGFIGDGQKLTLEGKYTVSKSYNGNVNTEVYNFKSDKPNIAISLVKLNDNLFHILTPDNKLMVGNGGWSYSLNRKEPHLETSKDLHLPNIPSLLINDKAQQAIFEGRTPFREFANEYHLLIDTSCFKLKWRITFNKDPKTLMPTTYSLRRVEPINNPLSNIDHHLTELEGKWTILKGTKNDSTSIVYQLDPDKPEQSIFLLVGDENVLFLLDKNLRLFVGNKDFSYTFNRNKM